MIINNDLIKYAYIRGYLKLNNIHCNLDLLNKDLLILSNEEVNELNELAKTHNIKTYYFKEKELLPRVNIVLGFLKGIEPNSLLDVGSGRGVFLFPLLNEFPYLKITSIDILEFFLFINSCFPSINWFSYFIVETTASLKDGDTVKIPPFDSPIIFGFFLAWDTIKDKALSISSFWRFIPFSKSFSKSLNERISFVFSCTISNNSFTKFSDAIYFSNQSILSIIFY